MVLKRLLLLVSVPVGGRSKRPDEHEIQARGRLSKHVHAALATLQEVLDVPVAIVASDLPLFTGLNAFGLVSGDLSYPSAVHANLSIDVKGSI